MRGARGNRPPWPFELNRDDLVTSGLVGYWPMTGQDFTLNLVTNHLAVMSSTVNNKPPKLTPFPTIERLWQNSLTLDQSYIDSTETLGVLSRKTFAGWFVLDATNSTRSLMGETSSTRFYTTSSGVLGVTESGVFDAFSVAHNMVSGIPYHVAFTYDLATVRFYVNGVLIDSVAESGSSSNPQKPFFLALSTNDGNAAAQAGSDWGIWNRPLNMDEIWALYDPATRWDLCAVSSRRTYFDVAITNVIIRQLAALGVG